MAIPMGSSDGLCYGKIADSSHGNKTMSRIPVQKSRSNTLILRLDRTRFLEQDYTHG